MKRVETTGKTVEEALRLAAIQLGAENVEDLNYEILEEGSKGFLGIGAKEYKIEARLKDDAATFAEHFVSDILTKMGIENTTSVSEEDGEIAVEISAADVGMVIGKHGGTLDSLQYLTNLVVNKKFDKMHRIRLDIGGYRERRLEILENMASRMAARVRKTKKAVALEPMNAYERRVIHTYMQKETGIGTKSEGSDPDRYVVIYAERSNYKKRGKGKKNFGGKNRK